MAEIKGKSADRKNAYLEIVDETVVLKIRPGMFSGKPVTHRIRLDDIVSIETKTGVKPYQEAQWILLSHSAGSVEFFTENKTELREVVKTVDDFLDAKAKKLKEDQEAFEATKEANLALITVNLELIDSLMRLAILLDGAVEWHGVEGELAQTEAILVDRDNVPNLTPASFSLRPLRNGVEKRLPWVIKQEVHDLVTLVSHEATGRAENLTPWFPSDFHKLFIDSSMTLWNLELAELTGVEPVDDTSEAQTMFNVLYRAVVGYTGEKELGELRLDENNFLAQPTLYRWVELLRGVPFNPELE